LKHLSHNSLNLFWDIAVIMSSSAVNRPTNVKQKEQDVNQKLQLYGIISGEHSFLNPPLA
jgi:hypothetical protein